MHPPLEILKVYIKALTGFSHLYNSDGVNNTLLYQGYALETAASITIVGGTYIPKTRKWVRSP